MSEEYDYGKRADDLADSMRRYLVGINTGGIAIVLTFAANLIGKGIQPVWVTWPVTLFAVGLLISGFSLMYAKHKALKRKQAKEEGNEIPKYDAWCQRNFTYELLTLIVFIAAVGVSIYQFQKLEVMQPQSVKQDAPSKNKQPNQAPQPTQKPRG